MRHRTRAGIATVTALALFVGPVVPGIVGSAVAAPTAGNVVSPYSPNAQVSVNSSNPRRGGSLTVSGSGFKPGEAIAVRVKAKIKIKKKKFRSSSRILKAVKADSNGSFTTTVKLPRKLRCKGTIRANADESDTRTKASIFIGSRRKC